MAVENCLSTVGSYCSLLIQMCKNSQIVTPAYPGMTLNLQNCPRRNDFQKKSLKPGKKEHDYIPCGSVYNLPFPFMFVSDTMVLPMGSSNYPMFWCGSCSPIPGIIYITSLLHCFESPLLQSFFPGTVSRRFLYNFVLLYGKGNPIVPSLPLIISMASSTSFQVACLSSVSIMRGRWFEWDYGIRRSEKWWIYLDLGEVLSVGSQGDKGIVWNHWRQRKTALGSTGEKWLGDVLGGTPQFILEPILLLDFKNRS